MGAPQRVYVVDDDEGVRALIAQLCEDRNMPFRSFGDGETFLASLDGLEPGCVLLDMRLPRRSGLEVQAEMRRRGSRHCVITITGHADVDMAVETMKMGAVDFLEKPFLAEALFEALERGFAQIREMREWPGVYWQG